jgi:hypothetical protein
MGLAGKIVGLVATGSTKVMKTLAKRGVISPQRYADHVSKTGTKQMLKFGKLAEKHPDIWDKYASVESPYKVFEELAKQNKPNLFQRFMQIFK